MFGFFVSLIEEDNGERRRGSMRQELEAFGPIGGALLGAGYGENLNLAWKFAEDHKIGMPVEDCAAGPSQIGHTNPWRIQQLFESASQLCVKAQSCRFASRPVSLKR
jgi:hypothetical protein